MSVILSLPSVITKFLCRLVRSRINATLTAIVINDGLDDNEKKKNPYGIARNLISTILQYRTYDDIYDETKAGFPETNGDLDTKLFYAGCYNKQSLLDYYHNLYDHSIVIYCYKRGLEGAAYGGHLDLVKYCISRGVTYGSGVNQASRQGHQDIVNYLMDPTVSYQRIYMHVCQFGDIWLEM